MENLYLGVDIGGTHTKYGFVKASGDILSSHKIPTNSQIAFADFTKILAQDVQNNLSSYQDKFELKAIGVGAPNANGRNGFMENPPNLGVWGLVDLVREFQTVFNLPTKLENDANIAAMGEKRFGKAKNLDNFVVVTLGTGVGTGSFINGSLYLGSHGIGSEAGHMSIVPAGRACSCGGLGHLESYVAAPGIELSATEILGHKINFHELVKLFKAHDAKAIKIVDNVAKELALGLSQMGAMLAPQAFILCGGVIVLGENFRIMVEKYYHEMIYPPFKTLTNIRVSEISAEFGAILGAASLVM